MKECGGEVAGVSVVVGHVGFSRWGGGGGVGGTGWVGGW